MLVEKYGDFVDGLLAAGFSVGGTNSEGIYSISGSFGPQIIWHTGDPETDPWEWRMRVLEERSDIAYGKVFFRKSGWISREWYPLFLAVRRRGQTCADAYEAGTMSTEARQIFQYIQEHGRLAYHEIRRMGGLGDASPSRFERALVDLQMRLFITMCGRQRKLSISGQPYGWASTVFSTTEHFFGDEVFEKALSLSPQAAFDKIAEQIDKLNPSADRKKVSRFILG